MRTGRQSVVVRYRENRTLLSVSSGDPSLGSSSVSQRNGWSSGALGEMSSRTRRGVPPAAAAVRALANSSRTVADENRPAVISCPYSCVRIGPPCRRSLSRARSRSAGPPPRTSVPMVSRSAAVKRVSTVHSDSPRRCRPISRSAARAPGISFMPVALRSSAHRRSTVQTAGSDHGTEAAGWSSPRGFYCLQEVAQRRAEVAQQLSTGLLGVLQRLHVQRPDMGVQRPVLLADEEPDVTGGAGAREKAQPCAREGVAARVLTGRERILAALDRNFQDG